MRKLSEIAQIEQGYPFRSSVEAERDGNVAVIQIKDLSAIDYKTLPRIVFKNSKYLLEQGDILIAARSSLSAQTLQRIPIPCITTSSVLRIRIHNKAYSPLVLTTLLNSDLGRYTLTSLAGERSMPVLSKRELGNFPIPDIDPAEQIRYANALDSIQKTKQALTEKLSLIEQLETGLAQQLTRRDH